MLRRFADARLARRLAEATDLVRRLDGLLRQKTAEARTNYDLMQRWKSIAQQAQTDLAGMTTVRDALRSTVGKLEAQLAAERARTQETQP